MNMECLFISPFISLSNVLQSLVYRLLFYSKYVSASLLIHKQLIDVSVFILSPLILLNSCTLLWFFFPQYFLHTRSYCLQVNGIFFSNMDLLNLFILPYYIGQDLQYNVEQNDESELVYNFRRKHSIFHIKYNINYRFLTDALTV